jgi:hypothetical protein
MFVFDENERDILFMNIYYPSVPVMLLIFYTTRIFLQNGTQSNGNKIFIKYHTILKNGMRKGKKSISLMLSKENKNFGLKNIFSLFESQF